MENRDAGQQRGAGSQTDRATAHTLDVLVRRQNLIHVSIIMLGSVLVAMGFMLLLLQLGGGLSYVLVGEGVALMLIGFVGLLMSFTTQDVAQGIRDAIHTEGELTRGVLIETRNESRMYFDRMLEKQDRMLEKQDRMLEKQDRMLEKQDRMLEKQDTLIGVQNRILEKVS